MSLIARMFEKITLNISTATSSFCSCPLYTVLCVSVCGLIVGGIPQIQRANADEFIHIFVNNSKKLTEFLEHMVKVCVCFSPFILCLLRTAYISSSRQCSVLYDGKVFDSYVNTTIQDI